MLLAAALAGCAAPPLSTAPAASMAPAAPAAAATPATGTAAGTAAAAPAPGPAAAADAALARQALPADVAARPAEAPRAAVPLRRFGVAAAHPLAAEAGAQVLREGGSAVDAAVAVQMVLGLVEPQSSGIGGGAFLLLWDGAGLQAWDGRETAPAAADARQFLQPDGTPLPLAQAAASGLAVGVPGAVRMLEAVHRGHGRLPWARLIAPAIALAEAGVPLGERLQRQLAADAALRADAQARALWFRADGSPHPAGTRLANPALAAVLRRIAAEGSAALHTGAVAADIVRRVQAHARPGRLAAADLAVYQPRQREPICTDWGAAWRVCGMGPPSSGHLAVMQMLGILERLPPVPDPLALPPDAPADAPRLPSADWLHVYTETARLAFADRAQYLADPDFVPAPPGGWGSLLEDAYLWQRASLVGARSMGRAEPGRPGGTRSAWAPQAEQPEHGTSHVSIVDAEGRAVALTTTIEAVFGSRIVSDGGTGLPGGFLLNNQLTDFALQPVGEDGRPVANRLEPGKRPRSSMSPTLVFERASGQLVMSLGSPGGAAIIHFTAKALVGSLQWGLDLQQAIALPNAGSFNGPTLLEAGRFPAATVQALQQRGHVVQQIALPSGLQGLQRRPGLGWLGGADPRRDGAVAGE